MTAHPTSPWVPCYDHAQFNRGCPACWRQRVWDLEQALDIAEDIVATFKGNPTTGPLAHLIGELDKAITALEEP